MNDSLDPSVLGSGDITGKVIIEESMPVIPDYQEDEAQALSEALMNPPGLVGQMVKSIRAFSRRDQPVLALSGAFTAMSAYSGNHYIVMPDKTPLSPYSINVSQTGGGKEACRDWIREVANKINLLGKFQESMSSSTAILRRLADDPCLCIMQDEFGRHLRQASGKDGTHAMSAITELMSLFGKGAGMYSGRSYADQKNNIDPIKHPFISLFGTTTSTELMAVLKGADVDSGFLNRCMLFETPDTLPPRQTPSLDIDHGLITSLRHISQASGQHEKIKIAGTDFVPIYAGESATEMLEALAEEADKNIIKPPYGSLWSRAHQNALIYAGLLALGDGMVVTERHAIYAVGLVENSINRWTQKMINESSESEFDAQKKKALKIIRTARKYSDDKKYGEWCKLGMMPRSKLLNSMHMDKYKLDRIIDTLLESAEICESAVDGSRPKKIHVYYPQ